MPLAVHPRPGPARDAKPNTCPNSRADSTLNFDDTAPAARASQQLVLPEPASMTPAPEAIECMGVAVPTTRAPPSLGQGGRGSLSGERSVDAATLAWPGLVSIGRAPRTWRMQGFHGKDKRQQTRAERFLQIRGTRWRWTQPERCSPGSLPPHTCMSCVRPQRPAKKSERASGPRVAVSLLYLCAQPKQLPFLHDGVTLCTSSDKHTQLTRSHDRGRVPRMWNRVEADEPTCQNKKNALKYN